jgi:hypothetical protein
MTFKSNKLDHGLDHGIVCQNNPISDMRVAIRTTRNTRESFFVSSHEMKSVFSIFKVPNLWGFFRQLPKRYFKI